MDIPKALGHGRKERVNMSTEQIEKWLNESSLAKEESKVEMESVANFKYDPGLEKPKSDAVTVPSTPSHGHISISPKIQHLVRPVNVTLSKLSDRLKKVSCAISSNRTPAVFLANSQITSVKPQAALASKAKAPLDGPAKERKEPLGAPASRKMSKDSSYGDDAGQFDSYATIPTIPTIRPSALEMPRGDLHAHSTIRCHPSLTYEHPFLSFLSYVADYPSTLHSSVTRKLSHYTQKCCRPATPKSFTSGFTYATTFLIKRRHTYYLSLSIFKK
jgi:hypothetical protein